MRCPFCTHLEDRVIDSRTNQAGDAIRRRRECLGCQRRYTTYERIEEVFPRIIKRDGSREEYNRLKVMQGLKLASSKRPISIEQLEQVVNRVEGHLLECGEREVTSEWVGMVTTRELRDLDPVAYIRFASVYRGFSDIEEFLQELRTLHPERADGLVQHSEASSDDES